MRVPKQQRVPVNISLPVDFYMHLEEIWQDRWNQGHTVLRLREFLAELVSEGYRAWEERNPVGFHQPEPYGSGKPTRSRGERTRQRGSGC
jgi:hypothetical protein